MSFEDDARMVQALVSGGLEADGISFSNYALEGPAGEPMYPFMYCCCYPSRQISYSTFENSCVSATERRELMGKILYYTIGKEVTESQADLLAIWDEATKKEQDFIILKLSEVVDSMRLPLALILFGRTESTGELVAYLFHEPMVPTEKCLEMMKVCATTAISKNN